MAPEGAGVLPARRHFAGSPLDSIIQPQSSAPQGAFYICSFVKVQSLCPITEGEQAGFNRLARLFMGQLGVYKASR
jgi:hypothetical protein